MNVIKLKNIEKAENHLRRLYEHHSLVVQETVCQTVYERPTNDDMDALMYQSLQNRAFDSTDVNVINGSVENNLLLVCYDRMKRSTCVLNYASYTNPGGGFLKGQKTQEECLCHSSTLFPALSSCAGFYGVHTSNDGLYGNDYIYSRHVGFFVKDVNGVENLVDSAVLTMAAPNRNSALQHGKTDEEIRKCFKRRMEYAYILPAAYGAETVFLGAWGCGVFGNNAKFVAETWVELQKKYNGLYSNVMHVIKDHLMYATFRDIMC